MTLPASFPMSMSQIAAELGLPLPLSINHPWVVALAGKPGLPVSFSDLLGQSGRYSGNPGTISSGGVLFSAPLMRGMISGIFQNQVGGPTGPYVVGLTFSANPNFSGNFKLVNNTTGVSAVLAFAGGNTWSTQGISLNMLANRNGFNDNFTITLSA